MNATDPCCDIPRAARSFLAKARADREAAATVIQSMLRMSLQRRKYAPTHAPFLATLVAYLVWCALPLFPVQCMWPTFLVLFLYHHVPAVVVPLGLYERG
jgi:hypothetical protein